MKHFLDTNVFMYAAGREHPLKAPCVAVLELVSREQIEALIDTEVLQEILYRYDSLGEAPRGRLLARLAVEQVGGEVLPVTLADMQAAFALLDRHGRAITVRDAVHAATMLRHGVTNVVSADRHFEVIEGLNRIEPGQAAAAIA